jgi:Cu(I)/Ag(I) efflux system membrane protein CusA/SilA
MIHRVIAYCAKNKFIVVLGTLGFTLWGLWAITQTPLDAIPDLSDVQVIVLTEWPGRSPDLVEDQITYPIVTTMLAAPKVQVVRGFSFLGVSFVYIIFEDGTDIYWARSRVLEYLNSASGRLPGGVTPNLGPDATGVGWVYEYALMDHSGTHDLASLRSLQDWYVRYWLESVPGVAEVASIGGFVKQYQVTLDPNVLLAYNLPISKIVKAIRMSNNDVGGRVVEFAGAEYMVRGRGYIKSTDDLEKIAVGSHNGTPVLLRDVAKVQLGPDIRRGLAELDGRGEVAGGIVVMRYGENALRVIQRLKKKIAEIGSALPKGVEVVTTYDRSELILESIATLKEKLIEESIVVSLICVIFLLHFRSALVAILALPIGIILSFIPMYYMGLTSNIMSLGGIAIAIGAMVDAAIVMVENAHKHLEHEKGVSRVEAIIHAAQEVGKPLFFSLLIITVSFMPVFTLEAQEGRLFKPLAFTKTFAMFFASFLSITLVPLLMVVLIKGKIRPEHKHPISRVLIALYRPFARLVLRFRKTTVLVAIVLVAATVPAFMSLGSEFMPPLYEGALMYMPVTLPGASITEVAKVLQVQDKLIKRVPEVEGVFGKAGRARSATDPAPLSMIETIITLKPEHEWRPGMTQERLVEELDQLLQIPGVSNSWTMPIKGRTDMLSTGIRTPVGIKIFGTDLTVIQQIGEQIEKALSPLPETRTVYAERVAGGYFFDFDINRDEAARYGLMVEEVEEIIETAIGGKRIDMTIEGRERYPINVRYSRELRDDINKLRRVLVSTPSRAQIPLGQLAAIRLTRGPPVVKSEDAQLVGYVFVDVAGSDIGGMVAKFQDVVKANVEIPPGYFLTWSGQYEYLQRAKERLVYVVPLTLLLIFVLLYFNFQNVTESLIVMLSLPLALVGGFWLVWYQGYDLSVAVWVGIIALAGVAAEIGVIMLVYLDEAYKRWMREGRIRSMSDLRDAVIDGAVQRVRPIMMTAAAITGGLLPIMWGHGTGASVMKRIAAPMVGGMVSATILTLLVIPSIYTMWRGFGVRRQLKLEAAEAEAEGEEVPA